MTSIRCYDQDGAEKFLNRTDIGTGDDLTISA
jgi:hypothetical protein